MRQVACVILMTLVLCAGAACQCGLTTTFVTNGGQSGIMFDVSALHPAGVEVTGFNLNLTSPGGAWNIEVYVTSGGGSHVGHEQNPGDWVLAGSFNAVTSNGPGVATPLPGLQTGGGPSGGVVIPPGTVRGFYVTTTAVGLGTSMRYVKTLAMPVGTVFSANAELEIHVGSGMSYPFGSVFARRAFSGSVQYLYPGAPQVWETNSPSAWMDIDGLVGDACSPVVLSRDLFLCPTLVPVPGTLRIDAVSNPGAAYELAFNGAPIVPSSGAGLVFSANGEILNLDVAAGLGFLAGITAPAFLPVPSGGISVPFGLAIPIDLAVQSIVTNAGFPAGFELTQPVQDSIVSVPGQTTMALQLLDDQVVAVDLVNPPFCVVSTPGVPFYGSSFSTLYVDSNGRVLSAQDTSDFSPTPTEALTDPGSVFVWSDFSPQVAGTVTLTSPAAEVAKLAFQGVPYFGTTTTSSFAIEFRALTGEVVLDGLQGVGAGASAMMLGISPGANLGPATDPGIAGDPSCPFPGFCPGVIVVPANLGTDMIYDFNAGGTVGSIILNQTNQVLFTPSGGGYFWSGI